MSTPQEVVANVVEGMDPWDTLAVAEAVLEALEAAGYSVVPTGEREHVVSFTEAGYVIRHPLTCRPGLFACHYNSAYFDGPPDELGEYRFRVEGGKPVLLGRVDADGA